MSKNYMTTVAAVLGVEMGDTFKVVYIDSNIEDEKYFQLTKKGLETSDDGIHWRGTVPSVLQDLMTGKARVATLPWKPRINETYYIPCIVADPEYMFSVRSWNDKDYDNEYYRMGLVCKTKEEAVELARRMLTVAKEGKNNG